MTQPPRTTPGQRRALGDFLQARRRRLRPSDVGLPPSGPRRADVLRREEVAVLANVSVTWYTWLEQGRPINPSHTVLVAVARALHLDPDETAHLLGLAGATSAVAAPPPVPHLLAELVESQHPAPALLMDLRWDLLAWNRAAEALWGLSAVPQQDRNIAWLTFHPELRKRLIDWDSHARRVVGEVRACGVGLAEDQRYAAVVRRLLSAHPEAEYWWSAGEVRPRTGIRKDYLHPVAGLLNFDEIVLRPTQAASLQLEVLLPVRGTGTAKQMTALVEQESNITAS